MGNKDRRILGIDIGGTSAKVGVLEPDGCLTVLGQVQSVIGDPGQMVERLAAKVDPVDASIVGIGTAGRVDQATGLVTASNLGWRDVPLRSMLEERLGRPVWVDNDAQAALTAEWYGGVCRGMQTAVYITLGTGIGGAVLLNGRPWRGHDNTAFELGHIVTHGDGLPCTCGKRGCYEVYASAGALSRMAGGMTVKDLLEGVKAGDAELRGIFDAYLHELAIGLGGIISLFQPQAIVIGGGISAAGDFLLDGVRRAVRDIYAEHPWQFGGEIHLASHQNDAGMIGAAVLAGLNL